LTTTEPFSDRFPVTTRKIVLQIRVLFSIVAFVGLVVFTLFFAIHVPAAWSSRTWPATPCTIISSSVSAMAGAHQTKFSYGVAVEYQYDFGGQSYTSKRYGLIKTYGPNKSRVKEIVRRLAPGAPAMCYVNPADPSTAVLDRSTGDLVTIGLISGGIVLLGMAGILTAPRQARALVNAKRT
jgi:hypothetical protein